MTTEPIPEHIGRYKVFERLGKGGFGTVYLAEQTEPIRRKVAVKVINPGMDSAEILARFEAERETLNLMNHPGIARLLDAGVTERGLPYFVMEYAPGMPLFEYVQRRKLDLRARLELFARVCEAVQHAHQKGVIHRDLSANNVLVTEVDDQPMPKIIDFGIAKSLTRRVIEHAVHTILGQTIGTPEFMSPEQAQGRNDEIDTRTDIYALGVQMYQLLTDTLPFPGIRQGGSLLMEKVISADEAEPPSTRVGRAVVQSEEQRQEQRRLARQLRGELDWITGKAMAKERERRYATAAALAADVQSYLRGEAVLAGPTSTAYRLRKLLRRHRGKFAAAAAVLVALVVGLVASVTMYLRAEENARVARANETRANENLAKFDRLSDLVRLENLERAAGSLGPELPSNLAAFDGWLAAATALVARLPVLRRAIDELRTAAGGVELSTGGWKFTDLSAQFLHDTMSKLVTDLERFGSDETGTLHRVRDSARWAATLHEVTVERCADAWRRAAVEVAADPRFAHLGAPITPQLGLVPIGADPVSGLQEFALPRSGKVPARDDDGRLRLADDTALILVLLPGGPCKTGSQNDEPSKDNYDPQSGETERPVHDKDLAPFFIGKFEVTQAQWRALTGRNPSTYAPDNPEWGRQFSWRHPVEQVSWLQADSVLTRVGLRLPTEVQWEYACRAGSTSVWWCGDDVERLGDVANVADRAAIRDGKKWPTLQDGLALDDGHVYHAPVGSYRPNRFGLHEMHGNVFEWCRDWYHRSSYHMSTTAGDCERRIDVSSVTARVMRGGSFYNAPVYARCAYRWQAQPDATADDCGLRAARALDPP